MKYASDVEVKLISKHLFRGQVFDVDIVIVSSLEKWRERPESEQCGWNVANSAGLVIAAKMIT